MTKKLPTVREVTNAGFLVHKAQGYPRKCIEEIPEYIKGKHQ
jgi:hypothetical protein